MTIKIYDHNGIELTALFINDYEGLSYIKVLGGVGSMEFGVRVDNDKITSNVLTPYNKIKLFDTDGKAVFTGYISENLVTLETVRIRCFGLLGLLRARVAPFNTTFVGTVNAIVQQIISIANQNDDTGISVGVLEGVGSINRTVNGDSLYDILDDITSGTSNQFLFNDDDGTLSVKQLVGKNLSDTTVLRYDTRMIANSNLSGFSVTDNADSVCSVSVGRVDVTNDTVVDADLVAQYGRVEKNNSYRTIANSNLHEQLLSELSGSLYSPDITLTPDVEDNFDIGDILGVRLYNKIIDIDTVYQVLEKEVQISGGEKVIKIKINKKQSDLLDILKKQEKQIAQLSNHL